MQHDNKYHEDFQGTAVILLADGSVVAVAADGTNLNRNNSGMVHMYKLQGSDWRQLGQNILGKESNDLFGSGHITLSSDSNCLTVGAQHNNNCGTGNPRNCYVFLTFHIHLCIVERV